ncbi:tRNA 2'-phosphotransferase 1 [Rhizopus azygosporus]|uniref:2'-phosphotransferase n=1 Tax=Rhizopus azygosporus TaxID=86630 RepID=A0A367KEA0_RHIAZ|nr:tRNA 2'-phosphotransferase 1 [Rhizopus azygosporus]
MSSQPEEKVTSLSKKLSYVLRHGALKENLKIAPDGFVKLDDLLKLRRFKGVTYPDIQYVVDHNDKKRFELKEEDNVYYIRATQGHSIPVINTDELLEKLDKVTTPVIHGTTMKAWESIKNDGLSKMNRIHIHFAIGLPNDPNVKSGVRKSSEVYIFIDADKAMKDGIKFYKSRNDVILSDGIDGTIPPKYFKKAIDKHGDVLYEQPS